MEQLGSDEIKLDIDDFGDDPNLSTFIRNYHGLAVDFARKTGMKGFIHTKQHNMRRV